MESSKAQGLGGVRPDLVGDLLRFALASVATGVAAAIAVSAVVILLA
jgi:hypothetical protein